VSEAFNESSKAHLAGKHALDVVKLAGNILQKCYFLVRCFVSLYALG